MTFLREKQTKYYMIFFSVCCLLLFISLFIVGVLQTQKLKQVAIEREITITSSLFKQGVPTEQVAKALNNESTTKAGEEFLMKMGHSNDTMALLFPVVKKEIWSIWILFIGIGVLFPGIMITGTIFFLRKREQIYQDASIVIMQYADGQFEHHLPGKQEGTIYQLFGAIEQLTLSLQTKSESEHKMKEFLETMISDISHQLKTPLAALQMYTEILMEEPDHPQIIKKFSYKSMQSIERMEQLIQSLLKMTRLDTGSIAFEKENVSVSELVEDASSELIERAEKENKKIVIAGLTEERVCCDLTWTREAIGNVIKNALDHTEDGGCIWIDWYQSPAMLRISIRDNGCGIKDEDIHHIFKRFYRSKNSSDRQGVGLGLPLAKAIVEGQGGMISVKSHIGEGSVFTISFQMIPSC